MRLHQVITGSRNRGLNCLACLNFSGSFYLVYGRGRNLVILDKDLFQVQVIVNAVGVGPEEINCISCEDLRGLISASNGKTVAVFEPSSSNKIWKKSFDFSPSGFITALSWFPHASICQSPLFTIGSSLSKTEHQISCWRISSPSHSEKPCCSEICQPAWIIKTADSIDCLSVSPDGRFVAASASSSCQIRIWCQADFLSLPPVDHLSNGETEGHEDRQLNSSVMWLPCTLRHPENVVFFSWRSMPRYLPPGWLPNALLTTCSDGVTRIWFEESVGNHRHRYLDYYDNSPKKGSESHSSTQGSAGQNLLPSVLFNHPVLSYYLRLWASLPQSQETDIPDLQSDFTVLPPLDPVENGKFFMAASINISKYNLNVLSDLKSTNGKPDKSSYILQWMNEKTKDLEIKLSRFLQRIIQLVASVSVGDSVTEHSMEQLRSIIGILDQVLLKCLSKWQKSQDILLMLHPSDGSLFVWAVSGLDSSALNGSVLSSSAHKFCDGSIQPGGLPSRVRNNIHLDLTQHQRVRQTSCCLRSRLPDTGSTYITSLTSNDPILFTRVYESGFEPNNQFHLLLVKYILLRAKLSQAVASNLGITIRNYFVSEIRKIQVECMSSPNSCGQLMLSIYSAGVNDFSGSIKHRSVGCSAIVQNSDLLDVTSTTSEAVRQANGHRESVILILHHPLLPLVLTLSASEFSVWHVPMCSPGPLSAPVSSPLRKFSRYIQPINDGTKALRAAAFFPCILTPSVYPNSNDKMLQLPLSIIAVESISGVRLICVDTTGDVVELEKLPEATMASASTSVLFVIPALSFSTHLSSATFLVIRVLSILQNDGLKVCRVETWRVDLNPDRLINAQSNGIEDFLIRRKSNTPLVASITKISNEILPMEPGVSVECVKRGPLPISWSNETLQPFYLIVTACSDDGVRFWTLETCCDDNGISSGDVCNNLRWVEWKHAFADLTSTRIHVPLDLLKKRLLDAELDDVSRSQIALSPLHRSSTLDNLQFQPARVITFACSTNWRVAIGCIADRSDPIMIAIYECESTGGSEWMLEDIIIPSLDLRPSELTPIELQSIQLDWVKTEDGGGTLLSFICGQNLYVSSARCMDVIRTARDLRSGNLNAPFNTLGEVGLRWCHLRLVKLQGDDLKSPIFPLIWLPNGLLMFHLNSHICLFSQWPSNDCASNPSAVICPFKEDADSGFVSMEAVRLKATYSNLLLTKLLSKQELQLRSHLKKFQANKNLFTESFYNHLGLFEAARLSNPTLPQFHPQQLLEWLNLGRFRLVQAILVHLTRCLYSLDRIFGGPDSFKNHLERSVSPFFIEDDTRVNPPSKPNFLDAELSLLPLYVMMSLDSLNLEVEDQFEAQKHETLNLEFEDFLNQDISTYLQKESDLQDQEDNAKSEMEDWEASLEKLGYLSNGTPSTPLWNLNDQKALSSLLKFGTFEGKILSDLLRRYRLPGLSQLDQIYLQGIVELLSNTQMEITERLSGPRITIRPSLAACQDSCDSGLVLDDCGLRFALFVQLYIHLCETLPPDKQAKMLEDGLTSRSFIWAFHSEAEEVLLTFLPSQNAQRNRSQLTTKAGSNLTWEEFRRFGCVWWIHSDTLLLQCAEKMGRSAFMANGDPMSAAIFYLAMNKPTVMASLYKTQGNRPLENFFRSDFSPGTPACRQAKMNAFRLLSQHKHVEAAALFLLGGWLEDAIRVCVHTIRDLQLAVFVCRLYSLSHVNRIEGEASTYHKILRSSVTCHEDPYLRSIGYWVLSEPLNALTTLLMKPSEKPQDNELSLLAPSPSMTKCPQCFEVEICPSVFLLYIYLRHHPLVLRNLRLLDGNEGFSQFHNQLTLLDRRLYFRTAYHYNTIGCPALALEVLRKLPRVRISNTPVNNQITDTVKDSSVKPQMDVTFSEEEVKFSFFDAMLDAKKYLDTSEFKVTFSDDENGEGPTDPVANRDGDKNFLMSFDINSLNGDLVLDNVVTAGGNKIQYQMKYWACLRIFTDELCTNFLTVSSDGSYLKRFLYTWLENEISQLEMLTLQTDPTPSIEESSDIDQPRNSCRLLFDSDGIDKSHLFPINYEGPRHSEGYVLTPTGEQKSFSSSTDENESKLRFRLVTNLEFLRSLVSFCCLHGESGVNLRIVRMELTHLLMDLFSSTTVDYSDRGRLLCSLPLLRKSQVSAPLCFTGHICHPLDIIKALINDITSSILVMPPPYMRFFQRLPFSMFPSMGKRPSERRSAKDLEATVRRIALLRNLCEALSACVFQSLSTTNWRTKKLQGDAGLAIAVGQSNALTAERFAKLQKPLLPNSEPSDWPGVVGLFAATESDSSSSVYPQPVLLGVLVEALVAVYMGLCVCALYTRDSSVLYRLASNASLGDESLWGRIFGGVCRLKPVRPPLPPTAVASTRQPSPSPSPPPPPRPNLSRPSVYQASQNPMGSGSSLLAVNTANQAPNRVSTQSPTITPTDELFLPPQCSMAECFLEKPCHYENLPTDQGFYYDSDESCSSLKYDSYSEGVEHLLRQFRRPRSNLTPMVSSPKPNATKSADLQEESSPQPAQSIILHPGCDLKVIRLDPDLGDIELKSTAEKGDTEVPSQSGGNYDSHCSLSSADREWFEGDSFSWRLMRLAFVQLMQRQLDALIRLLNLENDFLISYAPTLLQARGLLEKWVTGYQEALKVCSNTDDGMIIRVIAAEYVPEAPVGLNFGQDQFSASDSNLTESTRRAVSKMVHIMKSGNSPFRSRNPLSLPVKRLWFCLLNQPGMAETFMRWIFHPKKVRRISLRPIKFEVAKARKDSSRPAIMPSQPEKKVSFHPDQGSKLTTNAKQNEHPADGVNLPASSGSTDSQYSVNLVHRELEPLLCMCLDKVLTNNVPPVLTSHVGRKMNQSQDLLLKGLISPSDSRPLKLIRSGIVSRSQENGADSKTFNYECVALATSKQLIEVSISHLLSPADWLFDDFEYDLETMRNPLKNRRSRSVNDFLLYEKAAFDSVDHSHEALETSSPSLRGINSHLFRGLINVPTANLSEHILEFSRRLAPTILRRNVSGVLKLSSHPLLSFYLCGTASGSVHVLEWRSEMPVVSMLTNTFSLTPQGHGTPITSTIRGNPVSALHLDLFGKRFGCGDTAGYFGLWNLDFTGSHCYPYFSCRCHHKGVLDFAFLDGGSTKLVTVGTGSVPAFTASGDSTTVPSAISVVNRPGQRITNQVELETANVVIWDPMEPKKSAAVMTFSESPLDTACTCVTSIPSGSSGYQLAVGTKRGEIAILDLRKKPAITAFNQTAHEGSALRSIICDSATDTLTTAGADGLVKVWRLSDPCHLLSTFRSDASVSHGGNKAAAAAAALFRGNQSAAVVVASRPGISQLVSLPSTSAVVEYKSGEVCDNLHLLTTRFLACGVNGYLQMCSVTPSPEPIWLRRY